MVDHTCAGSADGGGHRRSHKEEEEHLIVMVGMVALDVVRHDLPDVVPGAAAFWPKTHAFLDPQLLHASCC